MVLFMNSLTSASETIHRRRWGILAVLCISLFIAVVDNTIVNVALPTLSRDLNASTSQLQWIVDAYSLVFASLLLVGGSLGDRFGRKRALQLGLILFSVCSLIAGLQTSAGSLILARGLMGIGAALIFPATLAILTNVFTDPVERAKAIGGWSAVVGLAVALGPISGGILLEHFWWGSIFLVNLPVAAVAFFLVARLVPSSKDPHTPPLDYAGFALSILTIGLLVYTTIEAPSHGWVSVRTLGSYAAALISLVVFVLWERSRKHPMLDVTVFANKRFTAASVAVMLAFFAFFGFIFLITQYFQFVRGYDTLSAGVHTLPFAGAAAITSPFAARIALAVGTKRTVGVGLTMMSVGFFYASTLSAQSNYFGPVVLSMVLLAIGLSLTTAPSTEAILGSLPLEKAGVGSAVNDTTRELGGTLGVAVIGSVFSSVYGPKIARAFGAIPQIPEEAREAARSSMGAAMVVAERAPVGAQATLRSLAQGAFMDGFQTAILVSGGATAIAALLAFAFMPHRATLAESVAPVEGASPSFDVAA
jgi:EmrB/QacA subfamily drug resistance transporter